MFERTADMKLLALATAATATAALFTAAFTTPAQATESVAVQYGDLDTSSPEDLARLQARVDASVARLCERPDMRSTQANVRWQQCSNEVHSDIAAKLEQRGITL